MFSVNVRRQPEQAYFWRPRRSRPLRLEAGCWQVGQGGMSRPLYQHSTNFRTPVDEQLSGLRARLLQDLALASRAADLQDKQLGEQPRCPECGRVLESQGQHERTVLTHGGRAVHLRRDYARCPACRVGLFPPR